jgi:hypothetical protein
LVVYHPRYGCRLPKSLATEELLLHTNRYGNWSKKSVPIQDHDLRKRVTSEEKNNNFSSIQFCYPLSPSYLDDTALDALWGHLSGDLKV